MVETTIDMGTVWDGWAGQWIRVKPHQSFAQKQRYDSAGLNAEMAATERRQKAKTTLQVTSVEKAWVLFNDQVEEWNLLDVVGEPIPLSRQGLEGDAVPIDLIEQAVDAIADFYDAQRPPVFRENASSV